MTGAGNTDTTRTPPRGLGLVVAGGGTGGHLFPGVAIAREWLGRHSDQQVQFIGTGRPLEVRVLADAGFAHRTIHVGALKGRTRWRQIISMAGIPRAVAQAAGHLKRFNTCVVLSVGGYSAGPVGLAARLLRIPLALHEQNRLPGITNRLLMPLASRAFVSFPDTAFRRSPAKIRYTGNPVRPEFFKTPPPRPSGLNLLVVGGSQGARALNSAVLDAFDRLAAIPGLRLVHQTGAGDYERVATAYSEKTASVEAAPFIDNMATAYAQADVIICRAGATTVAEVAAAGKPAILVPYPFAADDHQTRNAEALVQAGAAEIIPESVLTGDGLADRITAWHADRDGLTRKAEAARRMARPDAARRVVDGLMALAVGNQETRHVS